MEADNEDDQSKAILRPGGRYHITTSNTSNSSMFRYVGDTENGRISGHGTFYFNDGKVYTGSWLNEMMDGSGTMTWPDGKCYLGEFKQSKKHGRG